METPPTIPPSIPQRTEPPPKSVPTAWVIVLSIFSGLLLLLNVFVSIALVPPAASSGSAAFQSGYVQGYVGASVAVPSALALGVACIWKSNRRPFRLLLWFCGAMAGLVILRIPALLTLMQNSH